jgi:PKD repeat protein
MNYPSILKYIIAFCSLLFFHTAYSQTNISCPSDYNYRLPGANNPQQQLRIKEELKKIRENVAMNNSRSIPDTLKIIPVVVHVLHDNGKGALTKAQIIAGLNEMNIDFRKLNADTTGIRSFFKPLLSDLKVELRLAQIDPDGNCTDGIEYINTAFTYNVSDTCKSVADWPPNKYFNFWVVNSIDPSPWGLSGIIAGYEKFPWFGINNKYGAVVRADYWNAPGRTLTHEVGHCLGLWHMWQDQSLNNWGDGCSFITGHDCTDNDDMVCDTPPMYQPNSDCDFKANSCSNDSIGPSPYPTDTLDMVENFMSYSTCKYMFTAGQKSRITAVFATYPELQHLVSYANLVATGTNDNYISQLCSPKADLTSNKIMICKNSFISFSDNSKGGAATTWNWTFPGGIPSSSTIHNPVVQYPAAGYYDVKLVVANNAGKDSITYTKRIIVSDNIAQYNAANYSESFEDSTIFYNDWKTPATNGRATWKKLTGTAYTGNNCMMINNMSDAWSGETIELITPSYNLSSVTSPELTFKIAYARYNSSVSEYLRIYSSTDCGATWISRYSKTSTLLKTVADQTSLFIPASQAEWKQEKASLTALATNTNVIFKFQFVSGKGNNIYLDDINIKQITEIEENSGLGGDVNIYPNPSTHEAFIDFTTITDIKNVNISVVDVLGKVATEVINTTNLLPGFHSYKINVNDHFAPGIYFIKMTSGSVQWTKKLIVE